MEITKRYSDCSCIQCDKNFQVHSSQLTHRTPKFCSWQCYNKATNRQPMRIIKCKQCPMEFKGRYKREFCSVKCLKKWESINRCGNDSWNWKGGETTRICQMCKKEFQCKKAKVKYGEGKFCSRKCASKDRTQRSLVRRWCAWCAKEIIRRRYQMKGRFVACNLQCSASYLKWIQPQHDTNIERIVEVWLKSQGIIYEKQHPVEQAYTIADFFIPPNILIYADGDYWHKSKKQRTKDTRQTKHLIRLGYVVYRLKGSEIHAGIRPLLPCNGLQKT